jgi:hypothetical protein
MVYIRSTGTCLFLLVFLVGCSDSPVAPSASVVVHDTLNVPGGTSNTAYYESMRSGPSDNQVFDDFVSEKEVTIRTLAWQGGYSPDKPVATSFYIAFFEDSGFGSPRVAMLEASTGWRPRGLSQATYPLDRVNEQRDVEIPCGGSIQRCGLYNYSVTLNPPFTADEGVRYWVLIQADVPFAAAGSWGWRRGMPDNSRAETSIAGAWFPWDLAFSLR